MLRPQGELIVTTPQRVTFSPGLGRGEKPINPFHVEEFDAEQVDAALRDAGFVDVEMRGIHHGARISAWEAENGPIVAAQIAAAVSDTWPLPLSDFVASVDARDFEVDASPLAPHDPHLAQSQDLLAIARAGV